MAVTTCKITAVVNGQTLTIGEIVGHDVAVASSSTCAQSIAMALPYPVEVDQGTAIVLTTAQSGTGASTIACGTIHYIVEKS